MSAVRGKVAVVTGAGSGIGRALAIALSARGARLAVSDTNDDALAETVEQVKAAGNAEIHSARLDVSDRTAFKAYASSIADRYGVVHQLYNNAGIAGFGPIIEADYADIDRVLAVNLWGVIHGTREFLPHLIASEDGHLVNISSLNGYMGQAELSIYAASKFAVRGFTESIRVEMIAAHHRVRVSVVHPGGVKTNISNAALAEGARRGKVTERETRRAEVYNEKLFKTSAAEAAKVIVDGVEAGRERILVGSDAKAVDLLVRLFPGLYPRIAAIWERHTFG